MTASRTQTSSTTAGTALVLLAAAIAMAGCNNIQVNDITARLVHDPDTRCGDMTATGGRRGRDDEPAAETLPMDTYVVRLLEFDDASSVAGGGASACVSCAAGVNCHAETPACRCSVPSAATPDQLRAMLSGIHFGALEYEVVYCLQILAIDRASAGDDHGADESALAAAGAVSEPCQCDDAWIAPAALSAGARLCALSAPYSAGRLDVLLDVQCRSDGSRFTDCLGLAP